MNFNPSVLGANRGHDQGVATPSPNNGADRTERASTGGGPPGARVKRQHGIEYMWQRSGVSDYRVALGMEPDDDLQGYLVHPLQLHCISHVSSWEFINLLHLDIQGDLGSKSGMQEQQRILQETWEDSQWEEMVRSPRQGEVTWSHLQPSAGLIKNSANMMHNRWVNIEIFFFLHAY
jgi:hypothetical protein